MKTYRHEFVLNAEIDRVWEFFTDPRHFELITPNNLKETLVSTTNPRLVAGTELRISTNLFLRRTWTSRITTLTPYTYVDEVRDGIFASWTHSHMFKIVDPHATLVTDEIVFECRYGPVGKILEHFIFKKLQFIFEQREEKTKLILESGRV